MRIDLFHNRIVEDTASAVFVDSVYSVLEPAVLALYPDATDLVMYDNYIADGLIYGGECYYPFLVIDGGEEKTVWVKWQVDKKRLNSPAPFSYSPDGLIDFSITDEVPAEISDGFYETRVYGKGGVKLRVTTTAPDSLMLVGKYSQSFVDEMARQLSDVIERAVSVEGIETSPIELELVFASGTYMEHTAEGVTYRRLLMVDGASRPRDFWVKWRAAEGDRAYTVSDRISIGEVIFELGEDASQKLREKEYRFLCGSNPSKYQAAMGKKNVTEWRDLIKRALRRGELTRTVSELEYIEDEYNRGERDDELNEELLRVMGGVAAPRTEPVVDNDDFSVIDDMLRRVLMDSGEHFTDDGIELDLGLSDEEEIVFDTPTPDYDTVLEEDAVIVVEDEPLEDGAELTPDTSRVEVAENETVVESEEPHEKDDTAESTPITEEPISEYTDDDETVSAEEEIIHTECEEIAPERDVNGITDAELDKFFEEEESETEEILVTEEIKILENTEEYNRRLREEARREYEEREAELRRQYEERERQLRLREDELRRENQRLEELAREHEARHSEIASKHERYVESSRAAEEELRRELEARERMEERERDRIAFAARQSILEAQRQTEPRVSAPLGKPVTEEVKPEPAPTPTVEYMAKRVKIIFRNSIELGIFGRIKSIIETTIVALDKTDVAIAMKAFPEGDNIVNINITRMPKKEEELLIAIVKAIGNGGIGVTKIILEDLQ